jgi:hypothetical protein
VQWIALFLVGLFGIDYFVDPVNGSNSSNGLAAAPWKSVQAAKLQPGDTINLMTGTHLGIGLKNLSSITIQPAAGCNPIVQGVSLTACPQSAIKGLTVRCPATVPKFYALVSATSCKGLKIDHCNIASSDDPQAWDDAAWLANAAYVGIQIEGTDSTAIDITSNCIRSCRRGIVLNGNFIVVEENLIDLYADDGIDCSSSNTTIQHNKVLNHYPLHDNNHNDAIQLWGTAASPLVNNVIDGNRVIVSDGTYKRVPQPSCINWKTDNSDVLQGIFIQGPGTGLKITNNEVQASSFNGISIQGIDGVEIVNNTVLKADLSTDMILRIAVYPDSTGKMPSNVTVRNNLATRFLLGVTGVTDDHNGSFSTYNVIDNPIVLDPNEVFVKASWPFDLHLKAGSPAIGTGSMSLAPKMDIAGKGRNALIDLGCYAR